MFALAMPLIPAYAFAGVGRVLPVLFWLIPVGFLLGVALNLANALIDLEEDAAGGAGTLAVVLGVKRSFVVTRIFLLLSVMLIALLTATRFVPARPWVVGAVLLLACGMLVVFLLFFVQNVPSERASCTFICLR